MRRLVFWIVLPGVLLLGIVALLRTAPVGTGDNRAVSNIPNIKCDGVTDDAPAINAASVAANRAGGGELKLPAGICGFNSRVTLYTNIRLAGMGRDATTLKLLSNINDYAIFSQHAQNVAVTDLTIDAGSYDGGANSAAVAYVAVTNGAMSRTKIINQGRFGFAANGSPSLSIKDNSITKSIPSTSQNEGILISCSAGANPNATITDNTLEGTATDICVSDSTIANNEIANWSFGAGLTFEIDPDCHHNNITNNRVHGGMGEDTNATWALGIEAWTPYSTIANNVIYDNDGDGIDIGGHHSTVVGNLVYDNGRGAHGLNGITARYGTASTFIGSISGTTLTVTGATTGASLGVGVMLDVAEGTLITALGTGSGGAGTYAVSISQSVPSTVMRAVATASQSILSGNIVFNSAGSKGSQTYSYYDEAPSSLFGIALDGNDFQPGSTAATNIPSSPTRGQLPAGIGSGAGDDRRH
jgi:hypothetical protein